MKRFLKKSGHADLYPDLKVNFIFGRNPTLTIYSDEGAVLDTIDLAPLTTDAIHALLASKGFQKRAVESSSPVVRLRAR